MGGGGSGATNNSVAEFKPPQWTQQGWQDYVNQGANYASQPYEQYTGQRIAGPNDYMNAASDMIWQKATLGSPDMQAARGQMTDLVNGSRANNPWLGSEFTDKAISDNTSNMVSAAQRGVMAQTDAAAALNGAFGGSAWAQQQGANQAALAQQVGQMSNQYRLANQQMGAQSYQDATNSMLNAANTIGGLAQDDWTAAKNLMGVGDAQRQYTQDLLNQQKSDWDAQKNYGATQLDMMGNILARASGGYGTNVSTNSTGYQTSPWTGLLGTAAAGYGAYKAFT